MNTHKITNFLSFPKQVWDIVTAFDIKVTTCGVSGSLYKGANISAGFYDCVTQVIVLNDVNIKSKDTALGVLLHEIGHWTGAGSRLARVGCTILEGEMTRKKNKYLIKHKQIEHTEEVIAQLFAYKINQRLNLDILNMREETEIYLEHYNLANYEKAEIQANRAVSFVLNSL